MLCIKLLIHFTQYVCIVWQPAGYHDTNSPHKLDAAAVAGVENDHEMIETQPKDCSAVS
jgi:hypothetical protein